LLREYSFQILQGLNYIHSKNISHGDIKSANILLSSDNMEHQATVKLIDFGCSQAKLENSLSNNNITDFISTIPWAAPEVVN